MRFYAKFSQKFDELNFKIDRKKLRLKHSENTEEFGI